MMKNLKTALFSMLAGAMMCACSSDKFGNEPDPVFPDDNGEGFYMGVDIQMPNGQPGSRSQTDSNGGSTGGTEVGQDYENTVSGALIVLASAENVNANLPKFGFIAASEVQNNRIAELASSASKQYRATARVQKSNIHWLYEQMGENAGEPLVYVFVFCNPTKNLVALFTTGLNGRKVAPGETSWLNEGCRVTQGNQTASDYNIGIWGSNSFLMNNERLAIRALPANEIAWENHNTAENAFHLSDDNPKSNVDNSTNQNADRGSVKVERSVARFDFRDGSPLRVEGQPTTYNLYTALYALKTDGTPNGETNPDGTPNANPSPLINVKLQKMCLVNMADSFYYIPRVSPTGQMVDYTYCGAEKPWTRNPVTGEYTGGNYVVGPNAKMYNDITLESGFSKYFNYPFFEDNGQFNNEAVTSVTRWDVVSIDDVLNGQSDNYKGENNTEAKPGQTYAPGGYKIWRYVTENVIPHSFANQVNGITTGVIFRGRILGSDKFDGSETLYPEEHWAKGNYQNLLNCLNGKPFTYNGKTMTIQGNSHTDPILYYYSGNLYMGWRTMRQAAIQAAITYNTVTKEFEINRSNSLYKVVFGDGAIPPTNKYIMADGTPEPINDPRWGAEGEQAKYEASADYSWNQWNGEDKPVEDEGTVPATLKAFREKVTGSGVAIYQSAIEDNGTPGYYCYYYYWNRHNDNGIPGVMGPMEFDVVRNNVYKLSVDKISRLGHPRLPDNDPDKPTPGTPDESDLIYLDVRVTIVPWAVRLNSIQF